MGKLLAPAFPPTLYTDPLVEVRVETPTSSEEGEQEKTSGRVPWQFPLLPLANTITFKVTYCYFIVTYCPRPGSSASQGESGGALPSEMTAVTAGQLPGRDKWTVAGLVRNWQYILSIFTFPFHIGIPDSSALLQIHREKL